MTCLAQRPGLWLVSRRHVDLLRVSSAMCRSSR
ncbi:MAG: putative leader peptide [Streptosporangiaceae bacterium]